MIMVRLSETQVEAQNSRSSTQGPFSDAGHELLTLASAHVKAAAPATSNRI